MKVLITGKKDRLWKAVGTAFSRQPGFSTTLLPVGSPVIETLRASSLDVVLYTLSSGENIELLRWIVKINPTLPLIAVVPAKEPRLRKLVAEEGVVNIMEVEALASSQIRSGLAPLLRRLGAGGGDARRQISDDLHSIRSALTMILGNAEIALKRSAKTAATRKQLEEIPRGVVEIERILRRLHRTVRTRPFDTPAGAPDRRTKK